MTAVFLPQPPASMTPAKKIAAQAAQSLIAQALLMKKASKAKSPRRKYMIVFMDVWSLHRCG